MNDPIGLHFAHDRLHAARVHEIRLPIARIVRLLAIGWLFHMKMLTRSAFNFLLGIIYPLFVASAGFALTTWSARRRGEDEHFKSWTSMVLLLESKKRGLAQQS